MSMCPTVDGLYLRNPMSLVMVLLHGLPVVAFGTQPLLMDVLELIRTLMSRLECFQLFYSGAVDAVFVKCCDAAMGCRLPVAARPEPFLPAAWTRARGVSYIEADGNSEKFQNREMR